MITRVCLSCECFAKLIYISWKYITKIASTLIKEYMSYLMTKPTKWHVGPAKTKISLGVRPVWSESSLSAWRKLWSVATHSVHSEDSDPTGCTFTLLVLTCRGSYNEEPSLHVDDQNGPRQANLVLIAYASSEGSGEPAHPHSLARTSAARSYKQWVKRNLQTESQIPGPSEWLGMRS